MAAAGVVLSVLKIAGIVLLVFLALVLSLLLFALFSPVSFYLNADVKETELTKDGMARFAEHTKADAGFHWLFGLMHGTFSYPEEESFSVRLLWKKWPKEERESTGKAGETADDGIWDRTEPEQEPVSVQTSSPAENNVPAEPAAPVEDVLPAQRKASARKAEPVGKTRRVHPVQAFFDGLYFVLTKPYEVLWKIQYTISSVCDKIDEVRAFFDSALYARAKDVVLGQTKRLLRGIRGRRIRADVLFGAGDPALTADVLALFSMLYPLLGPHCRMEADFERRILRGDVHVKGRITMFRLLTCTWILYRNRDVRKAWRRAMRILQR